MRADTPQLSRRPTVGFLAKRRRGRHPKGGRVTPKGTRPIGVSGPSWSAEEREPDLMHNVRRKLRSGEPLDLLAEVSSLLILVDPREYGFGRRPGEPPYSRRELVDIFLDVDRVKTSAMLAVMAELASDDDVLATRIRRELAERRKRLPEWLDRLRDAGAVRGPGDGPRARRWRQHPRCGAIRRRRRADGRDLHRSQRRHAREGRLRGAGGDIRARGVHAVEDRRSRHRVARSGSGRPCRCASPRRSSGRR